MSIRHLLPIIFVCASLSPDAAAQSSATVPVVPSPVDGAMIEPAKEQRPEEIPPPIREEDVPADIARPNTAQTSQEAQRRPVSEGAADEGADLVLRTPDGTERMRITAAGNVGIGTAAPSTKLQVVGPLTLGKKIIGMPWTNMGAPPPGYVKLVTPIVHTESNMFQIHIVGYRYSPVGDSIDIRCSGYAYAGNYLFRTSCQTDGTDLPVEIGAETRPGGTDPVVVVRIGTPTTTWYYSHFSAEYDGWIAKSPSDFQWVVGETTPAQTGNLNNIFADDNTGNLRVGAVGSGRTTNRLTVNGATTLNGRLFLEHGVDNSQALFVTHQPTFEVGSPAQTDYGVFIQATEQVQSGASNTGGLIGSYTKSHLNGPGTMTTGTANYLEVGTAVAGGTLLSGIGLRVNFSRAAGSTITTGTGVYVSDVLATNDWAFYQAGADDSNYFAGDLTVGAAGGSGPKVTVNGNIVATGSIIGATVVGAIYQDLAEWVPASSNMEPGTVVVLNHDRTNEVMPSHRAYDTSVAGVVSAQPGILLGVASDSKEQIATTGRVKVRVDATRGAIRVGDLLVTSDIPGTAMKSIPIDLGGIPIHRPGTIIGKALEPLESGEGEILVLLSMQ